MKTVASVVALSAAVVVIHLVLGCTNVRSRPDVSQIESRLSEIELIAPPAPPLRLIRWDSASDIPREKMVWIEVFNGVPRVPKTQEPISDVKAYVDEAVERLGEAWVVVRRIHMKMQPIEKDWEVIEACDQSRARAVILPEPLYLGGRLRSTPDIPVKRFPKLPDEIIKRGEKAAQPGATDNPDDAQ